MDHRDPYAGRCWGKSVLSVRQRMYVNALQVSAGRPDRPALEEDTLAVGKPDGNIQKSKL